MRTGRGNARRGRIAARRVGPGRFRISTKNPTLLIAGARVTRDALEHLAAMPLAPGSLFHGTDRYGVRRQIGVGGMGIVYEVARSDARDQIVALKTLLPLAMPPTCFA